MEFTHLDAPARILTDLEIFGSQLISQAVPYSVARAFLFNKDRKLAVMYQSKVDYYSFPGGRVEEGETPLQAVYREVLEETGYLCQVEKSLGYVLENRGASDRVVHSYFYIASVQENTGSLHLTPKEISTGTGLFGWFTPEEAKQLILSSSAKSRQGKYLQARDLCAMELLEERKDLWIS